MKTNFLLLAAVLFLTASCWMKTPASGQTIQLYGMTEAGGVNNDGVMFQFGTDSVYTKRLDFAGASNGSNPYGALMQATDGNLYGMTSAGGTHGDGVLFQYNPVTFTYSKKLDFAGTTNGSAPFGSLMQAFDGNLYGMAQAGGVSNGGVIFKFNPSSSTYTPEYNFATGVSGPATGEYPYGALTQATDSNLYGLTSAGGTYTNVNGGVLFQFNPVTSTYTKMHDFAGIQYNDTDGAHPFGSLIQATDGNLYGMTQDGGTLDYGILFLFDPSTLAYTIKHNFGVTGVSGVTGPVSGISPNGSLVQAADGKLYGLTKSGGVSNVGVLFQYDPGTSSYTKKFDFDGTNYGASPHGTLLKASNGNLYGMTQKGGANNFGVLFQYNPATSILTKKVDFTGPNGQSPYFSNLIEVTLATTINEFTTDNELWSIYPNPVTDQLIIKNAQPLTGNCELTVFNVLGEAILNEKLNLSNYLSINIKNFPSGIYFLQLKTEKESTMKRFVKADR